PGPKVRRGLQGPPADRQSRIRGGCLIVWRTHMSDDFFGARPFKPADALQTLKRSLRDLRPLAERGNGFELAGKRVVEVQAEAATIVARLAKRPAHTPEWEPMVLKNSADVRKCVDEVKKRLARWTME